MHLWNKKSNKKKKSNLPAPKKSVAFEAFGKVRDGYIRMDISGNVKEMNDKAKDILGYDHTEEKVNARSMIHKEDFAYTLKSFTKLYKKGELKNYNARVSTKDGIVKRVHINTKIIYDDQHKPIGAHGVIKEITNTSSEE